MLIEILAITKILAKCQFVVCTFSSNVIGLTSILQFMYIVQFYNRLVA